jgi:hypothetical protein
MIYSEQMATQASYPIHDLELRLDNMGEALFFFVNLLRIVCFHDHKIKFNYICGILQRRCLILS